MTVSIVYDVSPTAVELKAGEEYYWCQCGRSAKQPFCDGSHSGTDIAPLSFSAKEDGTAYLCQCKQSRNPPYCDGSHKNLQSSDIGNAIALVEPGASLKAQPTPEETTVVYIHDLAENGLSEMGHHGAMCSMGVPRNELPQWDEIQLLMAQFASKPLMETDPVTTELEGATRLHNFFSASTELMQVMARACGHDALDQFNIEDLTTWKKEMGELAGIGYAGVGL